MSLTVHRGGWVIVATFVVALLLTMMPLPGGAATLRPEWVAMVLIYWCMALPERVGVGIAWMLGLLLDVVRGAILGQYALALTAIAFVTLKVHQRLRLYPLWQQALIIWLLISLELLLVVWIKGIVDQLPGSWDYWLPALTSALLWPWCFILLRDIRRRFQVR